jgi:hypothetical protein
MSYRNQLNSYITQLHHRLRLGAWLRGAAIFTGTALLVTVVLVLLLNQLAFPAHGISLSRVVIFVALAAAAIFGVALPIRRLTAAQAVRHAELASAGLGQRLTTYQERASQENHPFMELLAADTLAHVQGAEPSMLVGSHRLFALGGAGLACLVVLVWMIVAGPGYLGYGASLLWSGPKKNAPPLYAIAINPGSVTVRRNSDQLITAHITGMQPSKAQLFAHYQSASGWEQVVMQRAPSSGAGTTYQFVLAGLPENVEYYVAAGPLVSSHYKMRVVDLPAVKEIKVTYHYPVWTGMKPVTEEHSGDLRAIEGTDAVIQFRTDRPLKDGQFVMDGGETIDLTAGPENTYQGSIHMEKDGVYYLAAHDEGQAVRLSEDYFIATDKAMPPEITIVRPGGDYRASPIEEVAVGVKGSDQFGLKEMHLHYSVNGGPVRDVNLLKVPEAKSADGAYTLALEDFKLVPGDLVSVYATAKDGHSEARTDISFIQVDPFEREFSQSQQSGAGASRGGGQSSDQTEISKREKELIAATWKQQNDQTATPGGAAAQGRFLSQAQKKLRDQVNALSVRMQSRDISEANQEFTDFDKYMRDAASAMDPAADKLQSTQWKDAIPLEQRALQALLHAEATLRHIQVAFGQQAGGGSGGNSGRDLASLFDLELDTAKNQYETAQSATPAERHEKDIEDTLAKLDALARRQQDLANQQQNPQQSFEQRWEQEMLRREAEQLQQQMKQLAEKGQQGSTGSQSRQSSQQQSSPPENSSGSPTSSGSQSDSKIQPGSQSAREQSGNASSASSSGSLSEAQVAEALNRLQQAIHSMRNSSDPGRDRANTQQAAEQLRQASNLLAATQQRLASGKVDSLAREAERLLHEEGIQAGRINKFASQDAPNLSDLNMMLTRRRELTQLAEDRQQLSDYLSNLQRNIRDAAREMAPNQPGVAQGLRDALTEMDNSDLDNHVQRTADWLRRGVDPNTRGTEDEIARGLAKLNQQLQQASKGMGQAKQGDEQSTEQNQASLMDQVERLRNQIESMMRSRGDDSRAGQNGQAGQSGQTDQNSQNRLSRNGHAGSDQAGQQRGFNSSQLGRNQDSPSGANSAQDLVTGDLGNRNRGSNSGDVRDGGGGSVDGTVWNNINTGNNHYGRPRQQSTAPDASGNPPDVEGDYQQGMRDLGRLRRRVKDDPQAAKNIAELTRQMQHLDPSRFPGNPAMVEEMHREILSSLDRLELQLQHDGISPQARTGRPYSVPPGYQDSVAEYYRRLSKSQ